jgi:peptidyl-prolyl cis-trans isomerase B (cyclophilin B)
MIRRILALAALLCLCLALPALADGDEANTETVVTLKTTAGDILLRFFPDSAPEHVKNFIWHAENTYPGCLFHRVIPGFMVQGGDPNSKNDDPYDDGRGGASYLGEGKMLPAEFNARKHHRGILSMARSRHPDSAGSQFFLMHGTAPHLDGKYTVFGEVIDGIEVVDAIVNAPKQTKDRRLKDRPLEDRKILEATIEQWPSDKVEAAKKAMWEADPGVGR